MFPRIAELEFNEVIEQTELPFVPGKSFLFDFTAGDFVFRNGKLVEITGNEALKQWIEKTIRTARLRFPVYMDNPDYGVLIDDLIGSSYPADFIKKEMENELKGAILQNQEVRALSNFMAIQEGSTLRVRFSVDSVYSTFDQEVIFGE